MAIDATGLVKYVSIPLSANKVLIRLENTGDLYDNASTKTVDLNQLIN